MDLSLHAHENQYQTSVASWLSLSGFHYAIRHFSLCKQSSRSDAIGHAALGALEIVPVIGGIAALADWRWHTRHLARIAAERQTGDQNLKERIATLCETIPKTEPEKTENRNYAKFLATIRDSLTPFQQAVVDILYPPDSYQFPHHLSEEEKTQLYILQDAYWSEEEKQTHWTNQANALINHPYTENKKQQAQELLTHNPIPNSLTSRLLQITLGKSPSIQDLTMADKMRCYEVAILHQHPKLKHFEPIVSEEEFLARILQDHFDSYIAYYPQTFQRLQNSKNPQIQELLQQHNRSQKK